MVFILSVLELGHDTEQYRTLESIRPMTLAPKRKPHYCDVLLTPRALHSPFKRLSRWQFENRSLQSTTWGSESGLRGVQGHSPSQNRLSDRAEHLLTETSSVRGKNRPTIRETHRFKESRVGWMDASERTPDV